MSEMEQAKPWWKHGYVWMVIGGPAVVVVAGFVTLYLAIRSPDPIVSDPLPRQPEAVAPTAGAPAEGLAPALQARNHAATGGVPVEASKAR